MEAGAVSRLKREDCKRITNDSRFSNWKILVGPSDWEDHSLGKEGAERYRVHNLPKKESPGVYELGVSGCSSQGREIGKLDPGCVVPVYLGQADNVRTRLQQYGRSGAHLGNGSSTGHPTDSVQKEKGRGLFEDLLSSGYPIVYRWAPMENQSGALKTENRLLDIFDYPWNRTNNGARRPDDVHRKLKNKSSSSTQFTDIAQKLLPSSQKKVGIRIESIKPISTGDKFGAYDDREIHNSPFRVFKLGTAQPRLVSYRSITEENTCIICGVDVGDGSVCRTAPVPGRQRCAEHKGMRIKGSTGVGISNSNVDSQYRFISNHDPVEPCGFILADGSPCGRHSIGGQKRCDQHKGSTRAQPRLVSYRSITEENTSIICGVDVGDGSVCRTAPVPGRQRCAEHKGMRIKGSTGVGISNSNVDSQCRFIGNHDPVEPCGFILADGSPCGRHPIRGQKRCYQHKGRRI
ncbi:unnamed protein product [Malus baccata var. baccata]